MRNRTRRGPNERLPIARPSDSPLRICSASPIRPSARRFFARRSNAAILHRAPIAPRTAPIFLLPLIVLPILLLLVLRVPASAAAPTDVPATAPDPAAPNSTTPNPAAPSAKPSADTAPPQQSGHAKPEASTTPLKSIGEIEAAIAELGDDRYWIRRRASDRLWATGQAAESHLRKAAAGRDFEIAAAAREILERFEWGMYPNTDPKLLFQIRQFVTGSQQERNQIVLKLLDRGTEDFPTLLALVQKMAERPDHELALQTLKNRVNDMIEDGITEGRYDEAELWLRLSAAAGVGGASRDYAAFLLMRGTLADRIAETGSDTPLRRQDAILACYLYRAAGDLTNALKYAKQANEESIVESIWHEQRDWQSLANRYREETSRALKAAPNSRASLEILGYLATYQRLAGQTKEANETLDELDKRPANPNDRSEAWQRAEIMFLNDRPEQAIDAFRKGEQSNAVFDLLVRQTRWQEALDYLEKTPQLEAAAARQLAIREAKLRFRMGQTEKASDQLRTLAEKDLARGEGAQLVAVIEAERQLGFRDNAFDHAATALVREPHVRAPRIILSKLFPRSPGEAQVWWSLWRQEPGGRAALDRIAHMLEQSAPDADFPKLLDRAKELAMPLVAKDRVDWFLWLADICHRFNRDDLGLSTLKFAVEVTNAPAIFLRIGDLEAEAEHWAHAAEAYAKAYSFDTTDMLPMYLEGWAMGHISGQEAAAKLKTDAANLLLLSDVSRRYRLAEALAQRKFAPLADQQFELILRTAPFRAWELGASLRRRGNQAVREGNLGEAANCFELAALDVLKTNTSFIETDAYLYVPHHIHGLRARDFVQAGRFDDAMREAKLAQHALPGDIDLVLKLVPELDRRGRKDLADTLFAPSLAFQIKLCEQNDDQPQPHNQLAWLTARAGRELPLAQQHAERAVALAPDRAAYRDTLAEALFRRGQRSAAIDQMIRCIELDPANAYFKAQLARFCDPTGDTPVPEED